MNNTTQRTLTVHGRPVVLEHRTVARPLGLGLDATTTDAIEALFWSHFAYLSNLGCDTEDAADEAANVAGDEANSKYDEEHDDDYAKLNAWFDELVDATEDADFLDPRTVAEAGR